MLPSRSRLESWNPDSLSFTSPAVKTAGESVEQAVDRVNSNIKIMPETKAWSGDAHEAASDMFDRAHIQVQSFCDYTTAIGNALNEGASTIGAARRALLDKADEVDSGPLNVTDGWVVLIDPGTQTAEQIDALMDQVATEQAAINGLLLAVGDADTGTADKVTAAAKPFGFAPPTPSGLPGMMMPGAQRPADEVPNPRDPVGLMQQATVRGEDMAMTVRETTSRYTEDNHFEKTLVMQDGSKHVITEYEPDHARGVPDMTEEEHFDANGNLISWTTSSRTPGGYQKTIMNWADGTQFVIDETPEGVRTASFNLPDGRSGILPPDSPLLTDTVPDRIGNVLTGLEAHIDRGGRIPMLSMDAVEKIGTGAKYGGPALGVMSAMYDFLAAPTPYDKCVSVFAGTFNVVGDAAGGAGGAAVGAMVPGMQAFTVPVFAVGGSYYAGEWMKSVGTKVGEVLCGG